MNMRSAARELLSIMKAPTLSSRCCPIVGPPSGGLGHEVALYPGKHGLWSAQFLAGREASPGGGAPAEAGRVQTQLLQDAACQPGHHRVQEHGGDADGLQDGDEGVDRGRLFLLASLHVVESKCDPWSGQCASAWD